MTKVSGTFNYTFQELDGRIDELSQLGLVEKLHKALQIHDILDERGGREDLIALSTKVSEIARKGVDVLVQDNPPVTARELLNISREIAYIRTNRLFLKKTVPDWLTTVEEDISLKVLPAVRSLVDESNVVKMAAIKGNTKRIAIDELITHMMRVKTPFNSARGSQDVYVGENSVFKRYSSICSGEEERVADCFGQIFDPELYVPLVGVRSLSVENLGFSPLSREEEERALDLSVIFSNDKKQEKHKMLLIYVIANLSRFRVFNALDFCSFENDRDQIKNYKEEREKFEERVNIEFKFISGVTFTFNELADGLKNGLIDESLRVEGRGLRNHINNNTDLAMALNFTHRKYRMGKMFLDFTSASAENRVELEAAYNRFKQEKWHIEHPKNMRFQASSLEEALLARKCGLSILRVREETLSDNEKDDLERLSTLTWSYIPMQVGWQDPKAIGGKIVAKPRVHNMLTLSDMNYHGISDFIFERIRDPMQFVKAVRTLYVQPGDLHFSNIGFHPVSNDDFLYFNQFLFTIDEARSIPFPQLQVMYLKGEIPDDATITYFDQEGGAYTVSIASCPAFKKALETEWNIDFFDTDLNLYPTNTFLEYDDSVLPPVRIGLLSTSFAYVRLTEEAIVSLRNDLEKVDQVMDYLKRNDHPLYHRMSEEQRNTIRVILDRELRSYSIDSSISKDVGNLSEIRYRFALNMAKNSEHELWNSIDQIIGKEKQIKQPENITERLKIARGLFPRATLAQQSAFLARMQRQKKYFEMWDQLNALDGTVDEMKATLSELIKGDHVPLSATNRELLKTQLLGIRYSFSLNIWLRKLKEELAPTFQNLVLVHFPIMKEILQLLPRGMVIPNHHDPIDNFLELVYEKQGKTPSYKFLNSVYKTVVGLKSMTEIGKLGLK